MPTLVSISQFARTKGISRQALYKAAARGEVSLSASGVNLDDPLNMVYSPGAKRPKAPPSNPPRPAPPPAVPAIQRKAQAIEEYQPIPEGSPATRAEFLEAARWLTPDEATALIGGTEHDLAEDPHMAREFRRHAAMEEHLAWKIISAPMHGVETLVVDGEEVEVDDHLVSVASNFIKLRRMPRQAMALSGFKYFVEEVNQSGPNGGPIQTEATTFTIVRPPPRDA